MNDKNFYEDKINEIREMIGKDIFKAKKLLDDEMAMPYIPLKFEDDFTELKMAIYSQLASGQDLKSLNDEQAKEFLLSGDELKITFAITFYRQSNVRMYMDTVKTFFNKDGFAMTKALMFEVLVEQNIDENIVINGIKLNPSLDKNIIDDNALAKSIELFNNKFSKEPNLAEAAIREFTQFILSLFPQIKNRDIFEMAELFINIVRNMFGEETTLTDKEQELFDLYKVVFHL